MTTNQTIDGVPRELLERFVSDVEAHCYGFDGLEELRALLDSTALQSSVPAIDTSALGSKPAAQPQGEPVAWMYEHDGLVHNEQFKPLFYVNRQVGVQEPWSETPLYAEQPAPVAVVLPQRKHVPDFTLHPMLNKEYTGWNAYDAEFRRLNPWLANDK